MADGGDLWTRRWSRDEPSLAWGGVGPSIADSKSRVKLQGEPAPTVTWHRGQPSTIRIRLGSRDLRLAGQLVELAGRALGPMGDRVRIVFTSRVL